MCDDNKPMVVICNNAAPSSVMPSLIMSASGMGIDEEVILFFCPGGAPAMVKGELEKIRDMKLKGLPDPVQLFNTIVELGAKIIVCELALENKGIKVEDLRSDKIEIKTAPSFLLDAQGAGLILTF